MDAMIEVLIVDDSAVSRQMLTHIIEGACDLRVAGAVASGEEALAFLRRHKPGVITMDIHMPGMGGFEATRRIMETDPVPIVMVSSSYAPSEVGKAFRAIDEGALAILPKPCGITDSRYEEQADAIRQTVRLMAEVKLVRRRPRPSHERRHASPSGAAGGGVQLVAIGASTGGPPVLQTILAGLPRSFGAPVLVVQHMADGFVRGMIEWLNGTSGPRVCLASDGVEVRPGYVYVAPDGLQMGIDASSRVFLSAAPPEHGLRPSVSFLFRSVAASLGGRAAGVLLTGMGQDGAAELRALRELGAPTIAQTRESCVVYGMPGHAVSLGGAAYQLPPEEIAAVLVSLTAHRRGGP